MCKFLETQGFTVICSILSIFKKHQKQNRTKFDNYFQIFIDVEISKLKERNDKNIYFKNNVVGEKIKFSLPYNSDLIVKNDFSPYSQKKIDHIIKKINNAKRNKK